LPDKQWHLQKKDSNLLAKAQLAISAGQFWDWEITILFYAALHYVDSFFSELTPPEHPKKHGKRRKLVGNHLNPIAEDYRLLNALSENARYESFTPRQSDIDEAWKYYQNIQTFMQTGAK